MRTGSRTHLPTRDRQPQLPAGSPRRPLLSEWQSLGLVRPVDSLQRLFDIGMARGQFLSAIDTETAAFSELIAQFERLKADGDECWVDADDGSTSGPSRGLLSPFDTWVVRYRIDVPWVREWLGRAIGAVGDYSSVEAILDDEAEEGGPVPDPRHVLKALGVSKRFEDWDLWGEPPPHPLMETREQFIARMSNLAAAKKAATPSDVERLNQALGAEGLATMIVQRLNQLGASVLVDQIRSTTTLTRVDSSWVADHQARINNLVP